MPITEINGQKFTFSVEEYLRLAELQNAARSSDPRDASTERPIAVTPRSGSADTSVQALSPEDRQIARSIEEGPKVARRVAAAMGNESGGVFLADLMTRLEKTRPELSRAFSDLEKLADQAGLDKEELIVRTQDGRQIRFSPGPTLRRIHAHLLKRINR